MHPPKLLLAVLLATLALPSVQAQTYEVRYAQKGLEATHQGTLGALTPAAAFQNVESDRTATAHVALRNSGAVPLLLQGMEVTAAVPGEFHHADNCGNVLEAGQQCDITLTFDPATEGVRSGQLTVRTDSPSKPTLTLALQGMARAPSATLSTPVFAATPVGSISTATATLTNTGVGPLSVTVPGAGAVTGSGSYGFVATTCASSLAVGGACTVTVRFAPTSPSAEAGTLTVATSAGSKSVALGSTGIQGVASVSPASLAFGDQNLNTTSELKTVTVTNTGTHTLTFTGVGLVEAGNEFQQTNDCASVAVGGTCAVNVTFRPAVLGARGNTLAFTHDGGGVAMVSLSGTGQSVAVAVSNGYYADGTYAKSCLAYLTGDATHTPATANGFYTIKPLNTLYSVYCDMTGGGWTRFDYMVGGHHGYPGDGTATSKTRVQASYAAMYTELGNVSAAQRVDIAGQSEACCDAYYWLSDDGTTLRGPVKGAMGTTTLTLTLNQNWRKALYRTRYGTDASVNGGAGAWVASASWFR